METRRLLPFYFVAEVTSFFTALATANCGNTTLKHALASELDSVCIRTDGRGRRKDSRDELTPSAEHPREYFHVHLEGGALSLEWVFSCFCKYVFIRIECVPDSEAECFFNLEYSRGVSGDMAEIAAWILKNRPLVQAVCVEAATT